MKSVLLGEAETLYRVYPLETRQQLAAAAGLAADVTLNKDDLAAHAEQLRNTRFIFSISDGVN